MEERGSEGGDILDEEGAGDGEEAGWSGPMTSARGVRRTACSSTVACEDDDTHVVASLRSSIDPSPVARRLAVTMDSVCRYYEHGCSLIIPRRN